MYNHVIFKIQKDKINNSRNKIMKSPNSTKNQSQKVPSFFLSNNSQYRKPDHAKSSKNLNISLGAHQSPYRFNSNIIENKIMVDSNHIDQQRSYKYGDRSDHFGGQIDVNRKLESIAIQNSRLKSQNEFLRKQLQKMKKNSSQRLKINSSIQKHNSLIPSRSQSPSHQQGDLRNTIKKQNSSHQQVNQTKQIKTKLEILTKQCKMHEQIIDKMQGTIRRLTDQNRLLNNMNKNSNKNYYEKDSNTNNKKQELQSLKDKVNLIMKQYSQLQSKMHSNELQWVIWKQQWITQKNIYLSKIKQLQNKLKGKENNQKKY